jgi:hypothetical protein
MKLVGERRAVSSVVFLTFCTLYLVMAMFMAPGELVPAMYALAGVYGLAFFALVAGYFWARWYAVGLGLYGVITSAFGLIRFPPDAPPELKTILLWIGGAHLAATVLLWGEAMSSGYDGQTAWREKFHMDENAVQRLGRAVIRAGLSLPLILLYAFMPKQPAQTVAGIAALLLAGLGLRALIQMKTWGVLAFGVAGGIMLAVAGVDIAAHQGGLGAALSGALLLSATAPFVVPMFRFVRPV